MAMKGFLFPILSEKAPIIIVVRVATTADEATIVAIYDGSVDIVLYKKTLKYMFSIVQAIWPESPTSTIKNQVFLFIKISIAKQKQNKRAIHIFL